MAIKLYDDTNFIMIANAIRAKNGLETQYKPSEMATAINAFKMAKDVEPNNTSSGLNVNFKDGADGEKYNSLILNIPPLQDGTGDPSPTNKRDFKDYARFVINYSGADTSDYETYTLNHSTLGGSIDLISGAESYFNVAMRLANYSNSLTTYTENGVTIFYLPGAYDFGDIYSESLKTVEKMSSLSEAAQNMPNNSIAGAKGEAQGSISFFIRADSFSTVSELIASIGMDDNYPTTWMETNTITSGLFTGRTELGVNNLWAIGYQVYDEQLSQDIPLEVSYKADPTLYANNLVYETVRDLLPQDTASGAIANFPDGSDGYPVVELKANIEPIQDGSGDPSPSNVRAISGRSSCSIARSGNNNAFISADVTLNNYLASDGTLVNNTSWAISDYIEVDTLLLYDGLTSVGTNPYSCWYDENKNFISSFKQETGLNKIKAPQGAKYIRFSISRSNSEADFATFKVFSPTKTITINFGQTVYGGVLNVTTGVLTVERVLLAVDGSEAWQVIASGTNKRYTLTLSAYKPNDAEISDIFQYLPTNTGNFGSFFFAQGILRIPDGNGTFATLADFKQWLENNTPKFLMTLATPYDIQLTPEEVKTILGVNNIYADSGDVEVTYRADIALYIDKISNS